MLFHHANMSTTPVSTKSEAEPHFGKLTVGDFQHYQLAFRVMLVIRHRSARGVMDIDNDRARRRRRGKQRSLALRERDAGLLIPLRLCQLSGPLGELPIKLGDLQHRELRWRMAWACSSASRAFSSQCSTVWIGMGLRGQSTPRPHPPTRKAPLVGASEARQQRRPVLNRLRAALLWLVTARQS